MDLDTTEAIRGTLVLQLICCVKKLSSGYMNRLIARGQGGEGQRHMVLPVL